MKVLLYLQVLKDFNHVNPQDDDEGKIFAQTRVMPFVITILLFLTRCTISIHKSCDVFIMSHIIVGVPKC